MVASQSRGTRRQTAIRTHNRTEGQLRALSKPSRKSEYPEKTPHGHKENVRIPHGTEPRIEPQTSALCFERAHRRAASWNSIQRCSYSAKSQQKLSRGARRPAATPRPRPGKTTSWQETSRKREELKEQEIRNVVVNFLILGGVELWTVLLVFEDVWPHRWTSIGNARQKSSKTT